MIFHQNDHIGPYTVAFPIKKGDYAESYRVKDASNRIYYLKLINYARLDKSQFSKDGNSLEIEIGKQLSHDNVLHYHDSADITLNGGKYGYIVFDFISGETVAEKIAREQSCSVYEAKQIVLSVLEGVKFLHNRTVPIIHNELTIQNIMLDMSTTPPTPRIIDFGSARYLSQSRDSFKKDVINPFYMAPEAYNGVFTVQSDLYAIGAMLYQLIFGMPPHFVDLSKYSTSEDKENAIYIERQKPLKFPAKQIFELDEQLLNTACKALSFNVENRFSTAEVFQRAITGELKIECVPTNKTSQTTTRANMSKPQKKGNGFADVAGMDSLKQLFNDEIVDVLAHPEAYGELNVTIPNGILLYGPPGCGKTFFAEKFAEEVGYNYMYKNCSDIASPYIHGGQTAIAEMFKEARQNKPTILFLDEIDAMIKNRSSHNNASESGEVNVFLVELNNCGKDGVFVIGACNDPREIDPAALRSGRLEMKYYVPNPDYDTRKALFQLYLKKTGDLGLDYNLLAEKTDGYANVDIVKLIEVAARRTGRARESKITMKTLLSVLENNKPNLTKDQIMHYESIRKEFEGGFNSQN